MSDDVEVRFGGVVEGLMSAIAKATEGIESMAAPIKAVSASLGELGEAVVAAFAVEKIGQFIEKFAELGIQTQRIASLLGIGTDQVAGFEALAKASGTSLDGMTMALERMGMNLARAGQGSEQARAALAALGVTAKQLQDLPIQGQLELLADRFSRIKDGIDKDAIAIALLGRAGAQMIPVFNQGAEALHEFQEMAERSGAAMSGDQIAAAHALHEGITELGMAFRGAGNTVMTLFQPALSGLVRIITDLVENFTKALRQGGMVRDIFDVIAAAAKVLATALAGAIVMMETLWSVGTMALDEVLLAAVALGRGIAGSVGSALQGVVAGFNLIRSVGSLVIDQLGTGFVGLARVIGAALTGSFREAGRIFSQTFDTMRARMGQFSAETDKYGTEFSSSMRRAFSSVPNSFAQSADAMKARLVQFNGEVEGYGRQLVAQLKTVWQTGADAHTKIERDKVARLNLIDHDALAARMKAIEAEIKALQAGLERKKILLDGEVAQHRITQDQKFAALETETEKEYQAELALLQKELKIDGLKLAQRQEVLNKISQLEQKHRTDMLKLDEQSIAAQQKLWTGYIETVSGAFNSQLRGLLNRTTTWGQAVRSMLGDLVIKFIEMGEKWTAEWIAGEIARTTATTTGAATRTAAEQGSALASLAANFAAIIKSIAASAAQTFAGVFGFLAPVMGPAAAGPAAAADGTVMAVAAAVPALDVGTDLVTRTGFALIHSGEKITPAQTSGPFTGGSGSAAAPSIMFAPQVSAIDASGVQAFLKQYAPQMARAIMQHMGLNQSSFAGVGA